ncbi:MAG: ATP-dependent DNA helicase RecG [Chitinophagales bacterium]
MSERKRNLLDTPIEYLKGVGPKRADVLKKELRIFSFGDLLEHYPFRYIDKTELHTIAGIDSNDSVVQLKGYLSNIQLTGEARKKRLTAWLRDKTGRIQLVWFKGASYMKNYLQEGKEYLVYGKPNSFNQKFSLPHPELELIDNSQGVSLTDRIQPVYSSTDKLKIFHLDSKGISRLVQTLFTKIRANDLPENLPESVRSTYKLIHRFEAYKNIHQPANDASRKQAELRLKFEEFFFIQIKLVQKKNFRHLKLNGYVFPKLADYFHGFYEKLPFELTGAQKRVLKEIRRDTMTGKHMNRLLQGDVGSGKTIVALMTMLMAIDSGFQGAMMAPTELLAQQHFKGISNFVEEVGVKVDILTGSVKGRARRNLLEKLELGMIDILIGTHALIEDPVVFKNLGISVIDEQHRFGVAQRAKLWEKNDKPPHVLVMTATPIPRTLAMTVYGDLDVSVIDELPPGRKAIQTMHWRESKRLQMLGFLKKEIALGRQVYIVYPLINESEAMSNYKDLMDGYESIQRAFPQPEYQISIVHGQMSGYAKDEEMMRFKNKETQIMVATTVIEVGVDVPNATVMVIESAERFGLAQLHQLRGRVGRGGNQSYCILMTGNKLSAGGRKRLATMVETTDGFKISEVDLHLRGPGNIEGTQQSGVLNLRIADIVKDNKLLQVARTAAAKVIEGDPRMEKPENQNLKQYLQSGENDEKSKWSRIS